MPRSLRVALGATIVALGITSTASANHLKGYALAAPNKLVTFQVVEPDEPTSIDAITGLAAGEHAVGIDVRPATGALYALTDASALYTVDPSTGAATFAALLSVPLNGTSFGIDFNPTVDRLRIVSDAGQNLRVNVATGATTVDTALSYAMADTRFGTTPTVVGAAYTNNDTDATTGTALFDIDTAVNGLVQQNPPNAGLLNTIGALGGDARLDVGFDVYSNVVDGQAVSNTAYASFGKRGTEKLYKVNLATGKATFVGPFGAARVLDIALPILQG